MIKKDIAIVGVGHWGKNLLRTFYQLGVVKVICDLDEEILNERKKEYPGLLTTTDFGEILNNGKIKGVVIATPAPTHYELAKKALRAGKDVFVEKPLSLTVKQGKELVKLAKERWLILMVDHLFLYHPAVVKLKSLIRKGELGEINYIYSTRLNFGIIRTEENALWSLAPHDVSMIIEIFENLPQKVIATGGSYINSAIPDMTKSHLIFKDGETADIFVSWLNPFKERKLLVIGTKKMAVFDDLSSNKLVIYPHKIKWHKKRKGGRKYPVAVQAEGEVIKISENEPLMEEAKHFLECVKKRKNPKTNGDEALMVLRVLTASQKSMDGGGKLIELTD